LKLRPQAIFSLLFFVFFMVFVYESHEWRLQARLYPWVIGFPMLLLALIQVILDLKGVQSKPDSGGAPVDFQMSKEVDPAVAKRRAINIFSWIFGFFLLSIILTACAWVAFWGLFVWLLNLPFPQGLILEWLGIGS